VRIRFDLSLVSTGFGVFAAAAGAAHVGASIVSGLLKFLPPDRLIPAVTVPRETWHILLWCAVSGLCLAAAVFWARHWFDRVYARDWARNLALRDRAEPSLR
jgi:hypothetical protein